MAQHPTFAPNTSAFSAGDPMQMPPDLNPFEATFFLLRNLSQEIADLKNALEAEQRERKEETEDLRKQIDDIRSVKNARFEEVITSIQSLWEAKTSRFEKFEKYVEEISNTKNTRIERLECKLDAEISDRFRVCQDILKKTSADAAQWRRRADRIDKDIVENKKKIDSNEGDATKRCDNLKEELNKVGNVLRENTMAKDPFKHFRTSPTNNSSSLRMSPLLGLGASMGASSTPETTCSPAHSCLPEIGASPPKAAEF